MTLPRGVIVGSDVSQEWLLPWWWFHYQSHNDTEVTFIDFGMSPKARGWCEARGRTLSLTPPALYVKPCSKIPENRKKAWETMHGKELWAQRTGWFKKPFACLLSPYQKTVWIDLDCEIKASIDPLFSFASNLDIALANDILPGCIYNSGVIVFKHGIQLFEKWAQLSFSKNHLFAGDQDVLNTLIQENRIKVHLLPSTYNWSRCKGENRQAKIIHWHGHHGKTVIAHFMSMSNLEPIV